MTRLPNLSSFTFAAALAATLLATGSQAWARTESTLVIEADTGKVLHADNATMPWYPASTSKLMTLYVTLQAVKAGRITLDTQITVSPRAAAEKPSKIGFKPGTTVTVDNALKILMVKSANDMAVVLAEGVSGSVESFASQMNDASKQLGMSQSSWVNPNGLPDDGQISSARDLAILARALLQNLPEYQLYWNIAAIQLGKRTMRNFNSLIGRYDGADGGKTGFICASGFNLVGSATRNGKRLIVVVLGSPSGPYRAAKAAGLLERGFRRGPLAWLSPSQGSVEGLQPVNATPPDLRDEMCGPHRKRPAAEDADEDFQGFELSSDLPAGSKASELLKKVPDAAKAIAVFAGVAKVAAEAKISTAREKIKKLAAGKKNDNADASASGTTAVTAVSAPAAGKPRAVRAMPGATDVNQLSATSFTSPSKPEATPLTALPAARDSKPALAAAPSNVKPATTAAKPAKPAQAAVGEKPAAKPATQTVAAAKPAAAKPAAPKPAKPATPKPATVQQQTLGGPSTVQ